MGMPRILMNEHFAALFAVGGESRFLSTLLGNSKAGNSLYNVAFHNEDVNVGLIPCFEDGSFLLHPACGPQWGLLVPFLVAFRVNLELPSSSLLCGEHSLCRRQPQRSFVIGGLSVWSSKSAWSCIIVGRCII